MDAVIRCETPADAGAIRRVTTAAFKDAAHSSGHEAALIDALRQAGALSISLVAVLRHDIVGHVAFSPIAIGGAIGGAIGNALDDALGGTRDGETVGWFGLGPVAVQPEHQGQGIGAALIRNGLERLGSAGAMGCVVLGDPAYYRRFGFEADPALIYPGVPQDYFMGMSLAGPAASGIVRYHAAFDMS